MWKSTFARTWTILSTGETTCVPLFEMHLNMDDNTVQYKDCIAYIERVRENDY